MKKLTDITKKTYSKISKNWDTKREYPWKPIVEFLEKQENKQNLKLLDLGCGTGRHLELGVKLKYQNKNIIGSDYSKGQLEIVKQKGFKTKLCNMTNLKFKDNSFDIIICIAAHHHLLNNEDQLKALEEINRILKPNGKVLISNWFPTKEFIKKELTKGKFEFNQNNKQIVKVTYTQDNEKYDRYYYLFKQKELIELTKKANLKIINKLSHDSNLYLELEKN